MDAMPTGRRGFTAIELLVTISIIAFMAALAAPAALEAINRSSVNRSADLILRVASQAQQFALRRQALSPQVESCAHYGVALIPDGTLCRVVLLYGDDAGDLMLADPADPASLPALDLLLPASARVLFAEDAAGLALVPLDRPLCWFYQYGTGRPLERPANQAPIGIATPTLVLDSKAAVKATIDYASVSSDEYPGSLPTIPKSPVCSRLCLQTHDGSLRLALAVYRPGLHHWVVQ